MNEFVSRSLFDVTGLAAGLEIDVGTCPERGVRMAVATGKTQCRRDIIINGTRLGGS